MWFGARGSGWGCPLQLDAKGTEGQWQSWVMPDRSSYQKWITKHNVKGTNKEITTDLLIKAKVGCVQKAARPATCRSQPSMEHFPWRPQLKLAYTNQSRVHLSVCQSQGSQCLQTRKYGYNTLHGACTSQRQLRSPALSGILKASQHSLIPKKYIHIKMICVQRLGLLWGKKLQVVISTVSILLEKKNAIVQSNKNSEKNCW